MTDMTAFEQQVAGEMVRRAGPIRPVDDLAVFDAVMAANRSHRWGFTTFSAVKFVVAGVIVALFGGFLLAGVLTAPQGDEMAPAAENVSLIPTGIEILSQDTWAPATHGLVADGEGILWALEEPGRLVRFDPSTDTIGVWTLADDITLLRAHMIASSDSGGVWLIGADEVRLFDGDRFTRVIEAPEALSLAVEADDASLWAVTDHDAVLHWDGSAWEDVGPGSPYGGEGHGISTLEVDSAGRPWIGAVQCPVQDGPCSGEVLVFDGSEWMRFDEHDAMPLGGLPQSITEMPDGSIWVATEGGLARFDGTAWTARSPAAGRLYQSLAASPDGTVWASSHSDSARVWRSDGTDWVVYSGAEGLPYPDWSGILAVVGDRVFLGTDAGTYQRMGDSWVLAWDVVEDRHLDTPRLLATEGDGLWVVDEKGVWHITNGTWTDELDWTHEENLVHDLALGPEGTVWIAGPDGIAYRDGGRWEFIDERAAGAVAVDGGGTVWAAAFQDGCLMWTLREEGGTWVREDVFGCPMDYVENLSLMVDGDGTVWLGAGCPFGGGLVRYAGGGWEAIEEIDGKEVNGAIVLGLGTDGAMWALAQQCHGGDGWPSLLGGRMARFDGGEVSTVELPTGASASDGVLGADGVPWTGSDRGPARLDGQTWQFPYEDIAIPGMSAAAVAPDGSVYGTVGAAILRLPPRPVAPAAESS